MKPERRPLGSSYPSIPLSLCLSVRPSVLSHVSARLSLEEYLSNLKTITSKIGENRKKNSGHFANRALYVSLLPATQIPDSNYF
jgi:hypothetical protein